MENEIFSYEEVSREGMIDMMEEADLIMGKQSSRIAALEAQNKKLVEALENSTQCLEAWKLYHPKFFDKADESAVSIARALLSEVTQ